MVGVGANEVRLGSPEGVFVSVPGAVVATVVTEPATVVDERGTVVVLAATVVVGDTVVDVVVVDVPLIDAGSLLTRNQRTPSGSSARTPQASLPKRFTDTCTPAHVDPYRAIDSS